MWRKRSLADPKRGGEAVPLERAPVPELAAIAAPPGPSTQTSIAVPGVYDRYFGLTARPFVLATDPDALFWTLVHRRANRCGRSRPGSPLSKADRSSGSE